MLHDDEKYYWNGNDRDYSSIEIFNLDCNELMDKWINTECDKCNNGMFDIVIVDPPFGIDFKANMGQYNRDDQYVIEYNDIPADKYSDFTKEWMGRVTKVLKETGVLWVVSGWTNVDIIRSWARFNGLHLLNEIIWHFPFGVFHRGKKFISSHYNISLFVKDKKKHYHDPEAYFKFKEGKGNNKENYEDRQDVWTIKREYVKGKKKTATVLPRDLVYKMIWYTSKQGDMLLDPMMGSGVTLDIGLESGLSVVGIEKDKETFDFAYENLKESFEMSYDEPNT